jgi:hypothetical protein
VLRGPTRGLQSTQSPSGGNAMTGDTQPHRKVRRELYCAVCGRAERVATGALLRYTTEGWPKCCKETMAVRDSDGPGAPNTDYNMEPLRDQEG